MNIISKKNANGIVAVFKEKILVFFLFFSFLMTACLQGPWEYYPEKEEPYRGVYTVGHIVVGEAPVLCFAPLLDLKESNAYPFAFYERASVKVMGEYEDKGLLDLELKAEEDNPNCFSAPEEYRVLSATPYELEAVFEWDSAQVKTKSKYSAVAKTPNFFQIKNFYAPIAFKQHIDVADSLKQGVPELQGFEYPLDLEIYKIVTDYDKSVGGVLMILQYSPSLGGESVNSSMNHYLTQMLSLKPDSLAFPLYSPFDSLSQRSYVENISIGAYSALDTLTITAGELPFGPVTLYFYATDEAYADYKRTLVNGADDPRIKPKTNIKNGMGVFSGMLKLKYDMFLKGEHQSYFKIGVEQCVNAEKKTASCRLHIDSLCADTLYSVAACASSAIKKTFLEEHSNWEEYLPKSLSEKEKNIAYQEALQTYCISSHYKNTNLVNCDSLKDEALDKKEWNEAKEQLWIWCSDRYFNFKEFPQCGSAMVSRYRLQNQYSSVLKKEVQRWCSENQEDLQCIYLKENSI